MRAHVARKSSLLPGILSALLLSACEATPTAPAVSGESDIAPRAIVVTPGLSVYTDRTSWEAAVATAGGAVVNMDFTGLTLGRITQLVTDYGDFGIVVDDVAASEFSNPGISIFPDASCSLGTGDCDVFTFNMRSASSTSDMPSFNKLGFPQDIIAFGGDFIQAGVSNTNAVTGPVTLQIGNETVVVTSYLDANGNGFFGFVATADDTVKFTFAQSSTLQNEIFQVYNPAYANAPVVGGEDPEEMIEDLQSTVAAMNLSAGLATSIDAKLRAAIAALSVDDTTLACAALQDLVNYVNAQRGKKLSIADADTILAAVASIRDELDC